MSIHAFSMIDNSDSYDFIFGYGSILNDFSRLSTTGVGDSSIEIGLKETETFFESGGTISGDTAVACYLSSKFGYCRSWSFRSPTGDIYILCFNKTEINFLSFFPFTFFSLFFSFL